MCSLLSVLSENSSFIFNWLVTFVAFLPYFLLALLFLFVLWQFQIGWQVPFRGKRSMGFFSGEKPAMTLADVAGMEDVKQALQEIVEFLKYPEKFMALGARLPRGVLLAGPAGTGKTLMARAVAGEAGVPFFSINGSEFAEMFGGIGARRVCDLFKQAQRKSPCVIFIDEIDALGRQGGAGGGNVRDEREQILHQILIEMDGLPSDTNIIVIAATSRPDMLDLSFSYPGRFDRQIFLDRPDLRDRIAILQVHSRRKPLEANVSLEILARQTPGFSGEDLANLLNEAAILAARRNKQMIGMAELEEAINRVAAGPIRKSRIISEREKSITAYHEIGHALVARMLPNTDPVHKVSIVAGGQSGGFTMLLPTEDRYLWSKPQFEDMLAYALGGHAAEQIIFGEVTTGASNDIELVTQIAYSMVTEYGMSSRFGPVALTQHENMISWGRDFGKQRFYSEETARAIDEEVHAIIQAAFDKAFSILKQNKRRLIIISERLIKEETLAGPHFEALFNQPVEEPFDGPSVLAGLPDEKALTHDAAPLQLPSQAFSQNQPGSSVTSQTSSIDISDHLS